MNKPKSNQKVIIVAVIDFPFMYVGDPARGRPLFNGQIFVGVEDLDPEIPGNQKQLNVVQEDGTVIPVAQPFILGSGGYPLYNGSPVRLDVEGNYSLKILSSQGAQVYYIENVLAGEPITSANFNEYLEANIGNYCSYVFDDIAEMQASTIDFKDGESIRTLNPDAVYEVLSTDNSAILLQNGLRARGVRQALAFESIAEMKSQPSGLFVSDTVINIANYYADYQSSATAPHSFQLIVGDLADYQAVRQPAAPDEFGDFDLGASKVAINSLSTGCYDSREWGCIENDTTGYSANLNAMFDAPLNNTDVKFNFAGRIFLTPSTPLSLDTKRKVTITGDELVLQGNNPAETAFSINNCFQVKWDGLDIDCNNAPFDSACKIQIIRETVKVQNASIYNFPSDDDVGFECARMYGFDFSETNRIPGTAGNNTTPGVQVVNCSFYNEQGVNDTLFDYDDNYCGGTGIIFRDNSEYWRVSNCGFFGLCVGVWVQDGANGTIVGSEFQNILCVTLKSYIASSIPEGGAVYVERTSGNSSKLTISSCKFNHNWGFSIRNSYNLVTNRPMSVQDCQFIANSFTSISLAECLRTTIRNNFFQRAYNYLALPSWPWASYMTGKVPAFIESSSAKRCIVENNDFDDLPNGYALSLLPIGSNIDVTHKVADNTQTGTMTGTGAADAWCTQVVDIFRDNDIL